MRYPVLMGMLFFAMPAATPASADDGWPKQTAADLAGNAVVLSLPETQGAATGSLTSIFGANGAGAGNMFDIEPATDIAEITGLDLNMTSTGETVAIEVYYKIGTSVGYETNPSAWTLFALGTGLTAGWDNPTFVDISGNGVSFSAGQIYGIYVHQANYQDISGHVARTNGGPNMYSNAELSLTTNCSLLYPAFGSAFFYRIWNGTLYYDYDSGEPLSVTPSSIGVGAGGTATFQLDGGMALAGRKYGLLGCVSGTDPGTVLPGGMILPLNMDIMTDILLILSLAGHPMTAGFIGTLDGNGCAEAALELPGGFTLAEDVTASFAWCAYPPFDFVSNPVELLLTND